MELKINQRFKDVIPPLTAEEYANLHSSIDAESCRDAIVKERIWESVKKSINLLQFDKTLDALKKRLAGQENTDKQVAEKKKIEKRLNALTALIRRLYEVLSLNGLMRKGIRNC